MFLAETWLDKARLLFIRDKLRFEGLLEFSREGRGGRVAILWKKEVDFSVDTYSSNHIDAIINNGKDDGWRFIGFYGEPDTRNHHISWATLRRLKSKYSLPWLYVGDFNEITRAHEKLGGRLRSSKQMEDFRDVLDECGFQDLGFSGNKFTWCNGHEEGHTVWERLDRAMGMVEWMDMFPASKVVHLESVSFNHKPLKIYLASIPKRINKPWRFEQMWMEDEGCREVVEDARSYDSQGGAISILEMKVDWCRRNLKWWSKVAFGNVTRKLKEKKKLLGLVEAKAIRGGGGYYARVLRLKKEISKLLAREEKMWKQRSRSLWLQEGDNNTRYFHS